MHCQGTWDFNELSGDEKLEAASIREKHWVQMVSGRVTPVELVALQGERNCYERWGKDIEKDSGW